MNLLLSFPKFSGVEGYARLDLVLGVCCYTERLLYHFVIFLSTATLLVCQAQGYLEWKCTTLSK